MCLKGEQNLGTSFYTWFLKSAIKTLLSLKKNNDNKGQLCVLLVNVTTWLYLTYYIWN